MSITTPIVFAAISYFLYASQAMVLEQKLSAYSPAAVLVILYIMMLPLALSGLIPMMFSSTPVAWPSGKTLWIVAVAAIVFFFADYFMVAAYASAYKSGTEALFAVVAVGALYPVFGSVMKYVWTRSMPNRYHVIAYVLAAGVLFFAAKGNSLMASKDTAPPTSPTSR